MLSRFNFRWFCTFDKSKILCIKKRYNVFKRNGSSVTLPIKLSYRPYNIPTSEPSVIQSLEELHNSESRKDDNSSDNFPQNIEHLSRYIKNDTIANFNNALSLAIKRDDLDKALKIWKVLNEQEITKNEDSYKLGVRMFVLLNDIENAEKLKNEAILLNYRSSLLYSPLLEYYCVTKNIKDLTKLHKEIIQYGVEIDSYIVPHLIIGFAKVNNYRLAIDTFYKFKEKKPAKIHYSVYNAIFPSLIQSRRYEEASAILKEMRSEIPFYFIKYTEVSSIAISGIVAYDSNFEGLINFFEELKEHKIFVSEDHILRGLRGFYYKRAANDFKELLKYAAAKSRQSKRRRFISFRQILSSLYKEYVTRTEVEFSEYLLEVAQEENMLYMKKFIAHQIRIYLKAGLEEKAYQLYVKYMNDKNISDYLIENIFYHYAHTENIEKAKLFLENLKSYDTAKGQFLIYCKTNNLKKARALFHKEIVKRNENDILKCFNLLFQTFIDSGRYEEAQKFYMEVRELNLKPDSQTLYNIMKLTVKTKSLEECLSNFEKLGNAGHSTGKTKLLNCVIEAFIVHNKPADAAAFFVENFVYNGKLPNEYTFEIMKPILTKEICQDHYESIIDYFMVTGFDVNN